MLIEPKDTIRIAAMKQDDQKEEPSLSSITVPATMMQHSETGTSQCAPPAVVGSSSPRSAPLESLCARKAAPVSLPPPPAWDSSGINWARKTSSSTGGTTKSRHRSRTFTDFTCSSSSCSSDDVDSSQSSVDLLEDVSKELLVPSTPLPPVVLATVVAVPDLPPQASLPQSNNNINSIINPYQQRPRRPEAQHAFNNNNAPPAATDRNNENGPSQQQHLAIITAPANHPVVMVVLLAPRSRRPDPLDCFSLQHHVGTVASQSLLSVFDCRLHNLWLDGAQFTRGAHLGIFWIAGCSRRRRYLQ